MTGKAPSPADAAAQRALRAALQQAANEARGTQGELTSISAKFDAISERVVDAIGGTASRTDHHVVEALQEAALHTHTALTALSAAKHAATRVG